MKCSSAALLALVSFALAPVASSQASDMQIAIVPARPTMTDDIVVRFSLRTDGCRLLSAPLQYSYTERVIEGLVFVTWEPYGCPGTSLRFEADLQRPANFPGHPGAYQVNLWNIKGGSTHATKETLDFTIGDGEWLIPAVSRADGLNGARWTTDLEISNTNPAGDADAVVKLTFLPDGGSRGDTPQASVVVPASSVIRLEDVLQTSFGLEKGVGALLLTSGSLNLRFSPSIGTTSGGGRIAQNIPAVPGRGKLHTNGVGFLHGIREDETARTNLALANAGETPAVVELMLFAEEFVATTRVTVPARGMAQVNRVVRVLGADTPVTGGSLIVTAIDAADGVAVMATVIDNATNAPRAEIGATQMPS